MVLWAFLITAFVESGAHGQTHQWHDGGGKPSAGKAKRYVPEKTGQAQQGGPVYCENIPFQPTVYINFAQMPVSYDYAKTIGELSRTTAENLEKEDAENVKNRESIKRRAELHKTFKYTIGQTRSWVAWSTSTRMMVKRVNYHAGCVYIDSIHIDGEFYYKVLIASELLNRQCKQDHVMEHEQLHVDAHRAASEKFEPVIRAAMEEYAKNYKSMRVTEDKYEEIANSIQADIEKITDDTLEKMYAADEELQMMIDTKGEYLYGSIVCTDGSFLQKSGG